MSRAFAFVALVFALVLPLVLQACACDTRIDERNKGVDSPVVIVQVVDASDGSPVARARLVGPRGVEGKSDSDGRATLAFAIGDAGDLTARAEDGRTGSVRLRPLQAGFLDVVIHVR